MRGTNFKMKDGVEELQRQTIMGDGLSNDLVLQDFVYQGFPGFLPGTENILWQVAIILDLWNKSNGYPIGSEPMYMGESVVDETAEYF